MRTLPPGPHDAAARSPFVIWTYWETPTSPNAPPRAAYLDLCAETLSRNCGQDFLVISLTPQTAAEFIPELHVEKGAYSSLLRAAGANIPQKTDILRLALLSRYGGVWCDADIVCFRSFEPFVRRMRSGDFDYVGFGCYYEDCAAHALGAPRPANWVMISRAGGRLVTRALQSALQQLQADPGGALRKNYHALGKNLLAAQIQLLLRDDPTFRYFHVSSRCVERDSSGAKWTNARMTSSEQVDTQCVDKLIFVPVYNTAPGFPPDVLAMTRHDWLRGRGAHMLLGRMFRLALLGDLAKQQKASLPDIAGKVINNKYINTE